MNWYNACIKKYIDFTGRARRKEFWMFSLFNLIFLVAATILDNIFGTSYKVAGVSAGYGLFYTLYALFALLPGIAVGVRRLHDLGKSGGYYFIIFIPIGGAIWMLVLMCTEGMRGTNLYGPDPKEPAPAATV